METDRLASRWERFLAVFLDLKLVVFLPAAVLVVWGLMAAPFDLDLGGLPRDPVPVDAIPDTGDNQQILFTEWPGRSPQDVQDQITYPLAASLRGVPGVKTIRCSSMFGFSSIFVIFKDDVEFYWSRSRLVEKLSSLPAGLLPDGVRPTLGPDATALGQVFWYTLEGRDADGRPVGGWDLDELRSVQDWYLRFALSGVDGVAEVASIGGHVREYQIDVDPDAMRVHGVALEEVFSAVRASNVDVGARTLELNQVEYVIRGLGFLRDLDDLRDTVVKVRDHVPITIRQIAEVNLGPALRRGALDKGGAEAVGGVVVVRYGENPLAVIQRLKDRIAEIAPGLPSRTLDDGTVSQVTVVPFYDRTELIHETLGTLKHALRDEILVTVIVVLLMVAHLRSAALISGLLPLSVLLCFVAMKQFGVDANIVALSGIAIAIGTMVDMGVVICESILRGLDARGPDESPRAVILRATAEVAGAVVTAVLTTVVSFLPVFAMTGPEGKLFQPLAFTKTFALLASIVVAVVLLPPLAHLVMRGRRAPKPGPGLVRRVAQLALVALTVVWLSRTWQPVGVARDGANLVFTAVVLGLTLGLFWLFRVLYPRLLRWCLAHKAAFLSLPLLVVMLGALAWLGAGRLLGWAPDLVGQLRGQDRDAARAVSWFAGLERAFPGLGKEFMPRLDEGSFLLMPVTMAHASIGEALDILQKQDMNIGAIPEVASVVGKIGRVESSLDPAPVSMIETVIQYHPEYRSDADGDLLRFAYDEEAGEFRRDAAGEPIPDPDGRPYRNWRPHVRGPDDIWHEIQQAARVPGATTASMLQPIETRRIMLQTGLRAPMGVKVFGPDLETIERTALDIERLLKEVPGVRPATVLADRIVGKPYLEIEIHREAIARYGLTIRRVQDVIEVAVGGRSLTTTVEGRERYPVRVRYLRELRDTIEDLERILVAAPDGTQVPLGQLASVHYVRGPQSIKSEDTFLVGYVLFDREPGFAEVDVVEDCQRFLEECRADGRLALPAGVTYRFAGNYENQVHAAKKLKVVLPLALVLIFLILYLQFRSVAITALVFSGVFVAWAGGFWMLWLYGQDWFLDFEWFGRNLRDLFQVTPINMSVAVWVGFLALFGIATDDGVLMATFLNQSFSKHAPASNDELREQVVDAGLRRIRPCLMTSATTILALLPVLTSTGRGADVMVPMAIPAFGGMTMVLISVFVVPVLYCWIEERRLRRRTAA